MELFCSSSQPRFDASAQKTLLILQTEHSTDLQPLTRGISAAKKNNYVCDGEAEEKVIESSVLFIYLFIYIPF